MPGKYFSAFKTVDYDGRRAVDVTSRATVLESVKSNPNVFYPYDLREGQRPDVVADAYYEDPYMSWLLYAANGTMDPYCDWFMRSDEFEEYVRGKYGSPEAAQRRVAGFRVNWSGDDRVLDASGYSGLSPAQRRYWSPIYGESGVLVGYERARHDWFANTNRVVSITTTGASGQFIPDEYVTVSAGPSMTGRARVAWASGSGLVVDRVLGDLMTGSQTLLGESSGATATISAATISSQNIPIDEEVFWSPVSSYDLELEANEARRVIRVVDRRFATKALSDLKRLVGR